MSIGMGLIIAPGESMVSVLPEEQSGVGSAVNDTVQELGGSLGVAVIGSLVVAVYARTLLRAGCPRASCTASAPTVAAANAIAARVRDLAPEITTSAHNAFITAMTHRLRGHRLGRRSRCDLRDGQIYRWLR